MSGPFDIFREQPAVLIGILTLLVIYVTMVYGPIAAALVELFPTRIRYTSMSLPYHIGNGWFGGLLPATAFAMIAQTGDVYFGLWYPIVIALGDRGDRHLHGARDQGPRHLRGRRREALNRGTDLTTATAPGQPGAVCMCGAGVARRGPKVP